MKLTKQDKYLIEEAKRIILKSAPVNLADTGDVGAALLTNKGNLFTGVCTGFYCGIGSCAEYQAIGNMISNGEKKIRTIVAVWHDDIKDRYEVIPPCGKCREMMNQLCRSSQKIEVIISNTKKVLLKELLPYAWDGTIDKDN
jgi:cytidine deaminase